MQIRCGKWCREKFPETSKIPPTKDELHQRIKYRNCQRFALKNFLKAKQEIPDAGQQRWGVTENLKSLLDGPSTWPWLDFRVGFLWLQESKIYWTRTMCFTANFFFPCTNICKCKVKCHNEVPASHTHTHTGFLFI